MKKRTAILFAAILFLASCAQRETCTCQAQAPSYTEPELRAGMNTFSDDMYRELSQTNEKNIFYSPFSISSAVSLLYTGSAGETAREIGDVMNYGPLTAQFSKTMGKLVTFHTSPSDEFECRSSQSLWIQKGFKLDPAYEQAMAVDFKSALVNVDFIREPASAKDRIDGWVAKVTRNRIKKIIPEDGIDADTRLILVNAIYFEGEWQYPFSKKKTTTKPFYISKDETDDCQLMYQRHRLKYSSAAGYQMVELPYKGGAYSMMLVVPKARFGISSLEKNDFSALLEQHEKNMKWEDVELYLPKFEFKTLYQLKDQLVDLGMKQVFTSSADLSGIASGKDLYVAYVIHKAYIKVDEVKTEAAAATAIGIRVTSMAPMPMQPRIIRADHPFMFAIRDNANGQILFMGRLSQPE